jgi:predicted transglutaminase-like cysteine proteinase
MSRVEANGAPSRAAQPWRLPPFRRVHHLALAAAAVLLAAGGARADDAVACRQASAEACRRLADAGDVVGEAYLAVLLEIGHGVPQDPAQAQAWYRRAADQGSVFARRRLAALALARPSETLVAPASPLEQGTVTTGLDRLPKWQRVRDWIVDETQDERDPNLARWAHWAESLRGSPMPARLEAINQRVNGSFRYAGDAEIWGQRNYWPTPSEVVAKGATDCKGFAIMKLWLARLAGVGDADLQLLVGTLPVSRQQHAVLRVDAAGAPVVLDSLRPQVMAGLGIDGFRPILAADLRQVELFVNGAGGPSSTE